MVIKIQDTALTEKLMRCSCCGADLATYELYDECKRCRLRFTRVGNISILLTADQLSTFLESTLGRELFQQMPYGYLTSDSSYDEINTLVRSVNEMYRLETRSSSEAATEKSGLDEATRHARRRIAEYAEITKRSPILDLVTGHGILVQEMLPLIPENSVLVCTDIRARTLAETRKNLMAQDDYNKLFVVCDIGKMPFRYEAFSSITAFGGMGEIANIKSVLTHCYHILEPDGVLAMSGDQFRDNSESLHIAEGLGMGDAATADRIIYELESIGFNVTNYEVLYEGIDDDELSDTERCPLPARGDWFAYAVVAARKPSTKMAYEKEQP